MSNAEIMIPWPKIGRYMDVVKYIRKFRPDIKDITWRGTTKLHGTNAGIRIDKDGNYRCQSRNRFISVESDNMGFAAFVAEKPVIIDLLRVFWRIDAKCSPTTFYGEFVGKKIADGKTAVSKMERQWVPFGVNVAGEFRPWDNPLLALGALSVADGNFDSIIPDLERITEEIDKKCPFGAQFGVDGCGEGVVWVPEDPELFKDTALWFKTKGEEHSKSKVNKGIPKAKDLELMGKVQRFVEEQLESEVRLNDGVAYLEEMGMEVSRKSTGEFLRYVVTDLLAEEANTMEALGISPKDVGKYVGTSAREWFFALVDGDEQDVSDHQAMLYADGGGQE